MSSNEGLVCAFLLDGEGGAKQIDWAAVEKWQPDDGLLWVHLDYNDKRSRGWITYRAGLPEIAAHALTAQESRPRSWVVDNSLSVTLRGVNLNPSADPEDMVSVRVWLEQKRIVTARHRRLLSVDDVRKSLAEGNGPRTTTEVLLRIADYMTNRIGDVIDEVEDQVDALQAQVLVGSSVHLRDELADSRRQIVALRRYLAPQREGVSRLYMEPIAWLADSDRQHFRVLADRTTRFIEDLDFARERAAVTQEELTNRLNEQLNQRMYVLTLVAAIFLPLGFVTGLLGINVGGIPMSENPLGFAIVVVMLVLITVGILGLMRSKRWI
jgi:zinc transporter